MQKKHLTQVSIEELLIAHPLDVVLAFVAEGLPANDVAPEDQERSETIRPAKRAVSS